MRGEARISPVYRLGQPAVDPDPLATYSRVEHLRRKAYREQGLIILRASELPEALRGQIQAWAEAAYG